VLYQFFEEFNLIRIANLEPVKKVLSCENNSKLVTPSSRWCHLFTPAKGSS